MGHRVPIPNLLGASPVTEQKWLTSNDFFRDEFLVGIVEHARENQRLSVLMATQALWRATEVFGGPKKNLVKKAISDAERLAEKEISGTALKEYLAEFRGLTDAGYEYGAEVDRMQNLELRMQGFPYCDGEVQCGLWQIAQIFQGGHYRWRTLINARQAVIAASPKGDERQRVRQAERLWQTQLVRDLFPNPFKPKVKIKRVWLRWREGTVKKIARSIYERNSFDELPILADALEEAGCDNPQIPNHLRGVGPHFKGCWALDLILGNP